MFRRNPTRIELNLDDLCEYEIVKKDLQQKNLLIQQNLKSNDTTITSNNGSKTRQQLLHQRIGFNNNPNN